jgi:hypothetical protein
MTRRAIQYTLAVAAFFMFMISSYAQKDNYVPKSKSVVEKSITKPPYKILTSGKRITIKSKSHIKRLMVWTSSGHRIVEQHQLDTPEYNFTVPTDEKVFFLMLETNNGNRYTDKIGVQ